MNTWVLNLKAVKAGSLWYCCAVFLTVLA